MSSCVSGELIDSSMYFLFFARTPGCLQSVGMSLGQNEPRMLLNSDGRAGVGAGRRAPRGKAGRVHLCYVVAGRLPLKGKLDVQVLGNGRVHDATGQNVGEATVVARASEVRKAYF